MKKGGSLVVNDYEIHPITVLIGDEKYPENVNEKLKASVEKALIINAADIAEKLGNIKAQNVVLLGALIKALDLMDINWEEILKSNVPAKAFELNKEAIKLGFNA